jgi:hypothetical protein
MPIIDKRNIEACEHAFEYWKQNATHTAENRSLCLGIAADLMAAIKAKAALPAFLALEQRCIAGNVDAIGHGGFGLHSAIIAVISNLEADPTAKT